MSEKAFSAHISFEARFRSGDLYNIRADHGYIDAMYDEMSSLYRIATLYVSSEARGQGIGKNLLRTSRSHAKDLGAKSIFAVIISRECIDAMEAVFGEEAIKVERRGEYIPPGQNKSDQQADAMLFYTIPPDKN